MERQQWDGRDEVRSTELGRAVLELANDGDVRESGGGDGLEFKSAKNR